MLAHVTRWHWHAVQLDVLRLGFRKTDIFTVLSVEDMVAICTAAPPGTAVHYAITEGWTTTDHLLATMLEQHGGLIQVPTRVPRPGVTDLRPPRPPSMRDHTKPVVRTDFDVMSIQEYERQRRNRRKRNRKGAS